MKLSLPEPITHEELWQAHRRWCWFCEAHYGDIAAETWPLFDDFLGVRVEWHAAVTWLQPDVAAKIHMLNGPYHFALCKAWVINHTE